MSNQRGYINIPSEVIETLCALAFIGFIALLGFAGYGLWWLVTHITFKP